MKRKTDEAGTGIELTGDDSTIESLRRAECFNSQRARLLRVAEIPQLRQEAEALLPLFPKLKRYTARREAALEHELIEEQIVTLERRAIYWTLAPKTHRDDRRQAGVKKPRGSRWPELDAWIADQLKAGKRFTAKQLWRRLPEPFDGLRFYRDGDRIFRDGTNQSLSFSGLQRRITKVKKSEQ